MHDLAEVFMRLARDDAFADELVHDPRRALEPYELSTDDLSRLATVLEDHPKPWPELSTFFEFDDRDVAG